MKNSIKGIFILAFISTIIVLLYEGMSLMLFSIDLENGDYGVPKDSFTYKLAVDTDSYNKSMTLAVLSRLIILKDKLLMSFIYTFLGCCILLDIPRLYLYKLSENPINFYTVTMFNINHVQVAITNIFVFLFSTIYLSEYIEKFLKISEYNWFNTVLIYLLIYSVICPVFVFSIILLLQIFGNQLILTIYISIILKDLYDILKVDKMPSTMHKVSPEYFSKPVEKSILDSNLQNNIFIDDDKSKETNAALVGLENKARIEIYGKFEEMPERNQDSILLHEIGHAKDHSLTKKLIVYFITYYLEICILIFLNSHASKFFTCEKISRQTSFVLLSIVYFLSMRDWMNMFYKLSSQRAEIAADMIAKSLGFGKELATSLFTISVSEISYIRPTWFYNALYAMHPSIYDRIEYLYK